MRLVIALGGNALLRPGERPDAATQRANLRGAAAALAPLAARHDLVLTHGNGPQIGWLAQREEAAGGPRPDPLDVLGAESEALIGYLLESELAPLLPGRELATLLTAVEVDPGDPAFRHPTKPIGPHYPEARARELAAERGWSIAPTSAGGWRRVVPSPEPLRILELGAIRQLLRAGVLVVCAGGGGIPVAVGKGGALRGVEAVVDKDLTAALLAAALDADALVLLTDVAAVYTDWPARAQPLASASARQLRARRFEPGSMGPKVEAACRFAERTGRPAAIGALEDAARVVAGETGTRVTP